METFFGSPDLAANHHRRVGCAVLQERIAGSVEQFAAALTDGIIQAGDKVTKRRCVQALDNAGPWGQQIAQTNCTKIMSQGCAQLSGGGQHGGDAWLNVNGDPAPILSILSMTVEQLKQRRAHGIDTWIAGAQQDNLFPLRSQIKREGAAFFLFSQSKVVARLVCPYRVNLVEIIAVPDKVSCCINNHTCCGSPPARIARPKAQKSQRALRLGQGCQDRAEAITGGDCDCGMSCFLLLDQ